MTAVRRAWAAGVLMLLAGCGGDPPDGAPSSSRDADRDVERRAARPYLETGDFDALKARGALRILTHRVDDDYLPRDGDPFDLQRRMAEAFAREHGLEPVVVPVADFAELFDALLAGKGDVVVANVTVTPARRERVAFTVGIDETQELVVGRADGPRAAQVTDLHGHTVGVLRDTAFWDVATERFDAASGVRVVPLSSDLTSDEVLDGLAAGAYDFALEDSNVMDVVEGYRDDVRRQFALGDRRPLAWAVRPDSTALLEELDRFIVRERLTRPLVRAHTDDLDGIRERRVLRMITRNNSASYYLHRGELVGFEYELARRFADQLGVRLQVVLADDHDTMIPMLVEGRGDFVAAFMARTPDRESRGVAFSRPYHYAVETVVGRADEPELAGPDALAGRRLHLRRGSSYWHTAQRLQAAGIPFELVAVPPHMETEEIIGHVARGAFDLTIADSHLLRAELGWRDDIRGLLELGEPVAHGWVVRDRNPALLAAIDAFWSREYRGLHYNVLYRRYFDNVARIQAHRAERVRVLEGSGRLSEWDDIVHRYAEQYGFDWRLILAQMYQESRFDPNAVSWVGARGLMQVMPRTGRELGLSPLDDPEISVHAGVKYMDWLQQRFPERLPVDERMWFALASYNAGLGHVRDARRLAAGKGWDSDRWFGHVEQAMLLLSEPQYHRQARHGFVRGHEPVAYVQHIRDRYEAYVRLTPEVSMSTRP